MQFEIVTDGTFGGTHVHDAETKQPVGAVLSLSKVGDPAQLLTIVFDSSAPVVVVPLAAAEGEEKSDEAKPVSKKR